MEDKFEQMQKVADEENAETRRKMVDSLLNSEARTKDGLKEELKKLVDDENISWLQMGRMFKVSDNAVRKWAKRYCLI